MAESIWDAMPRRQWELMVWDIPKPQGRKRIRIRTKGGAHVYPEKKDDEARYQIRRHWMDAYGDQDAVECDLALSLVVAVPCPKSISLKRRRAGARPRGQRAGDLDNYVKAIMDALLLFAYRDDSQVQEFHEPLKKVYAIDTKSGRDIRPYLWIRLEEL